MTKPQIKHAGGKDSYKALRSRHVAGGRPRTFRQKLGLDIGPDLDPLPYLNTFLGWPAPSGCGRRDVG